MTREDELELLIADLREMVALIEMDPLCRWTAKFRMDLANASQLLANSFNQDDLANLTSSIRSVYGGVGSFNDYLPGRYDPTTGHCVSFPWADQFDRLSTSVFDRALALVISSQRNRK
jgi:hypothetical protein